MARGIENAVKRGDEKFVFDTSFFTAQDRCKVPLPFGIKIKIRSKKWVYFILVNSERVLRSLLKKACCW
jgi:hypothetical protein